MEPDHRDDEIWMARIAQGDDSAFRLLVDHWERPLISFFVHCLGDEEEARDLAQETFLRVYRHAGRYRAEGRFRSWLFRIAGNLCRGRHRRRRLVQWVPFLGASSHHEMRSPRSQEADAQHEADEFSRLLREVLDALPLRQRMAFTLRRIEELSYREIAEAMGTTESAVESLLVRATRFVQSDLRRRGISADG